MEPAAPAYAISSLEVAGIIVAVCMVVWILDRWLEPKPPKPPREVDHRPPGEPRDEDKPNT
jgi:hypothetical protein